MRPDLIFKEFIVKTSQKASKLQTAQTVGTASILAATLLFSGCSSVNNLLSGDKVDYKSSGKAGPSLDVPPDLTQLSRETRYVVPGSAITASAYQLGSGSSQIVPVAATSVGEPFARCPKSTSRR